VQITIKLPIFFFISCVSAPLSQHPQINIVNTAPKLNGLHHNLQFKCESENNRKNAHTNGIPMILQLENEVRHNLQNTAGEDCAEH